MNEPTALEPAPVTRPRRRWLRRLLASSVIVVAVVAGWCLYVDTTWDRELREAIAETDRGDPGWRLMDIEDKRPTLSDEENSSPQIVRLKLARPARWLFWYFQNTSPDGTIVLADYEEFRQRFDDAPPPVLLDAEQERVLRSEMTRGTAAVAEARKLIDLPRGRHPIVWRKDYVSSLLPCAQETRESVQVLQFDARLRCHDGDVNGAIESARASFNASLSLRDEPLLISQLVHVACRSVTLKSLERTLAQGETSEDALAAFQHLLEGDEPENLFLVAVRGERGLMDGFLEVVQRREMTHAQLRQSVSMLDAKSAGGHWAGMELELLALHGTVRHERAEMLGRMNRLVEIAQLTPEQQGPEMDTWQAAAKEGTPFVRRLTPGVMKVNFACRRSHAEMRCMIVLLALERFRRANGGRWPERLDELTPRYLDRVPLDPFDGRPMKYARRDDGVTVYTVGPDGEDNGGNLDGKWLDKGSDWGFRLWDVDRRRQPPRRP